MRIAVFGTGGAGGYFGAQLALAGEDVIFIARGDHLRAGLRFETPSGETIIRTEATDNSAEAGNVDAVLVGVKAWQVTDAANAMRPLVGPETVVVPLQNGVEAATERRCFPLANRPASPLEALVLWPDWLEPE